MSIDIEGVYIPFFDWANKHGLDAARDRFRGLGKPAVDQMAERFRKAQEKVQAGGPPIIAAGDDDWYGGPDPDFGFWPSLLGVFRADGWPDDRIDTVDRSSTKVVAHTPRPSRKSWDSKGLVVGYVQSGKTTNFTAVIAKLADLDYDLVLVLSGIHNGLRRQTQERLDLQLKNTNPNRVLSLTTESKDFHIPPALPGAMIAPNDNKFVLAVAKKNAAVLRRLIRWLDSPHGKTALASAKCLVIDDEADQASVATGRINPLIRKIMSLMPRCTYIGYTATPFANVFIDPNAEDLYPKDFILNLPRPDGYFGPEMIFGRPEIEGPERGLDGYDMVRTVPDEDLPRLRPVGKNAHIDFEPDLTDELVDAVRWFWLATAARRARGDDDHSTMLVHTSVKTSVHESFKDPLDSLRLQVLRELDGANPDLREWRRQWEQETARVPAGDWSRSQNSFDEVAAHLPEVVRSCRIVLDNSRSEDRLDYTGKDPVVAIAVGGNTLSRGLTLEGLVASFFVRSATTYDTLLQMGRWFGFRPGYEDLPRIWMTDELRLQFRHLAQVEYEMRQEIEAYQLQNKTPTQLAVRIRTHPSMRITAKMGAAAPTHLSYAGRRMQTRYFKHQDPEWLANNIQAAERLLQEARKGPRTESGGHVVFRDVPVSAIKAFLKEYSVHEEAVDMEPSMILKYIDKQLEAEDSPLQRWSVAVVAGDGEEVPFGGETVKGVIRSQLAGSPPEYADIKTLMSKEDIVLDTDIGKGPARSLSEAELKARRLADPTASQRGLLVLYPIDKLSPSSKPSRKDLAAVDTVVGIGFMFPGEPDETNKILATHMAVELTGVEERLDQDELDAVLDEDFEGEGP